MALEVISPGGGVKAGEEVTLEPGGLIGVDLDVARKICFCQFFSTEHTRHLLHVRLLGEQRLLGGRGGSCTGGEWHRRSGERERPCAGEGTHRRGRPWTGEGMHNGRGGRFDEWSSRREGNCWEGRKVIVGSWRIFACIEEGGNLWKLDIIFLLQVSSHSLQQLADRWQGFNVDMKGLLAGIVPSNQSEGEHV